MSRMEEILDKPLVIFPQLGEGDMPDSAAVEASLKRRGVEVLRADFSNDINETIANIPWHRVSAIDLRNMRGGLTQFDFYTTVVDLLSAKISAEKLRGHHISMTLSKETIEWVAHKAVYFAKLKELGISTLPTKTIEFGTAGRDIANFTDTAKVSDAVDNAVNYIKGRESTDRFVLKPSTSALAQGLIFIDYCRDEGTYSISQPQPKGASNDNESEMIFHSGLPEDEFKSALNQYLVNYRTHDKRWLLQDFIENLETSAVYVDGKPHFVTRHTGETDIAHGNYGGVDKVTDQNEIDPKLIAFVDRIHSCLPECVRNSPFFRIDVMKNLETDEYMLGEIEGAAAARLWLSESGKDKVYAKYLKNLVTSNQNLDIEAGYKPMKSGFQIAAGGGGAFGGSAMVRAPYFAAPVYAAR